MRLVSRLLVFASSLFVVLYGILPGFFKVEGAFVATFVAGRNFIHGVDPILFYQFPLFQKMIDLGGLSANFLSFLTSTPSSIVIDAVFGIPPAAISRILLTGVNIVAFVMAVHATAKIAGSTNRTTYVVFLISSFALATNFQSTEPYIILTLLFVMAFYSYSIGKPAACGAFLGLAFPFNPLFSVPVFLFLLSAKWRTFTYFLIAAAGVLALTFVVVGQSTFVFYIERVIPAYLNSRILDPFSNTSQTAWSFFRKLFVFNRTLNVNPVLKSDSAYLLTSSIFRAAVVVPPAYFFYKGLSRGKTAEALAAATFPLLFLLPVYSPAELVLLAPAILVNVQAALDEGRRKTAWVFVILYAVACIPLYSIEVRYFNLSSVFLSYESFILIVAIYVVYLVFQSRVVPSHLRPLRLALTAVIVGAVSLTLFLGDRFAQDNGGLPLEPVIGQSASKGPDFSPAFFKGHLTYISPDSSSKRLYPKGVDAGPFSSKNIYKFSSAQFGGNYAIESTEEHRSVVYFKTRSAGAIFPGHGPCVSRDGDYGSYMRDGSVYVVDLDPRYIAPVDTLSLLPYRISECSFNSAVNNEIVFIIDSLNSSYAAGTYNLFSRKITTLPISFRPSLLCAVSDTLYMTQDVADTTVLWESDEHIPAEQLLSLRGDIYDLSVLNHSLYLSSDYERGLDNPTVYEYVKGMVPDGPEKQSSAVPQAKGNSR